MDMMDDHSNTSNEISMAVNELHALTQENLPDKHETGIAQKSYHFPGNVSDHCGLPLMGNSHSSGLSRTSSDNNLNALPGLSVQMNSQYISKIICPISRRLGPRSAMPHLRMRPYWVPARHRTRSENSGSVVETGSFDINEILEQTTFGSETINALMDTYEKSEFATTTNHIPVSYNLDDFSSNVLVTKVKILKKSKSLEELRSDDNIDGSQPSHEMEFVSNRIQKLKVQE
ncbi:uncharacterized protein LOC134829259 [Culicoides brevitarsis]|uniref:uncharacterized protein LOC134829259 n=1 Tax=Culicoides brevitarsis TaxID=469753 RepID=UPI00307C8E40